MTHTNAETDERIATAAQALGAGGLVAFPTETVYGLGADATDDTAVARVFAAKGRPDFNPLIVHAADAAAAGELGRFTADAETLAAAFWPGPLTLVVARKPGCPVSALASAGLDSIALRVPAHAMARDLLAAFARPVVAPSANRSGRISPTEAAHVRRSLGDEVDMILNGGPCVIGIESTIVACMDGPPTLLRPGGLETEEIEACLGQKLALAGNDDAQRPQSPGRLRSHYAPRAALRLDAADARAGEALLAFGGDVPAHDGQMRNLSASGDVVEAAANLFRQLHELDETGVAAIAVMAVPQHGLGRAINDRLARAAARG